MDEILINNRIRASQYERNQEKCPHVFVFCILVGILFAIGVTLKDYFPFLSNVAITTLGKISMVFGCAGIIVCIVIKHMKKNTSSHKALIRFFPYVPMMYVLMADLHLVAISENSNIPFMMFALIVFLFIALYDIPVVDFVAILVTTGCCFISTAPHYLENKETALVTVLYTVAMVATEVMLDMYSCKNLKQK